jgi:hypothetical protein
LGEALTLMNETERMVELQDYLECLTEMVNYVNQTFSLFWATEAIRSKRLSVPTMRE